MATVYTHISPFQKRAISFFKQRIYEIGKRDQINSVLDELLRKQEFFDEFLASFGMMTTITFEQRQYVRGQLAEVECRLVATYAELETLKGILKSLSPCPKCEGRGEFRHPTSMYGIDRGPSVEECIACDGDGVEGGAITTYPARGVQ